MLKQMGLKAKYLILLTLATVEKKITDFSDFVKKEDYDVQV